MRDDGGEEKEKNWKEAGEILRGNKLILSRGISENYTAVEVPGQCPLVLLVNVVWKHFEDRAKALFCRLLTDFRKSIGFWKVPRLRPIVLLVRAACR
jgi:hypothetical protein